MWWLISIYQFVICIVLLHCNFYFPFLHRFVDVQGLGKHGVAVAVEIFHVFAQTAQVAKSFGAFPFGAFVV